MVSGLKSIGSSRTCLLLTHGGSDGTLRVGSNVGRDHDETKGKTDRLTVDQPETDKPGPGVGLFVGKEDLHDSNGGSATVTCKRERSKYRSP